MGLGKYLVCIKEGIILENSNDLFQNVIDATNFDPIELKEALAEKGYASLKKYIEEVKYQMSLSTVSCGNYNEKDFLSLIEKLELILKKYPELEIEGNYLKI